MPIKYVSMETLAELLADNWQLWDLGQANERKRRTVFLYRAGKMKTIQIADNEKNLAALAAVPRAFRPSHVVIGEEEE